MKVKAEKKHEAGKKFLTLAEGKVPAFQVKKYANNFFLSAFFGGFTEMLKSIRTDGHFYKDARTHTYKKMKFQRDS